MFGSCTHPPATPPSSIPASLAADDCSQRWGLICSLMAYSQTPRYQSWSVSSELVGNCLHMMQRVGRGREVPSAALPGRGDEDTAGCVRSPLGRSWIFLPALAGHFCWCRCSLWALGDKMETRQIVLLKSTDGEPILGQETKRKGRERCSHVKGEVFVRSGSAVLSVPG